MARKKISPKVQQATEKYLASLGSSREKLTQEQWEIIANHIRLQRITKLIVVILLIGVVINLLFACIWLKMCHESMETLISEKFSYINKFKEELSSPLQLYLVKLGVVGGLVVPSFALGCKFCIMLFLLISAVATPFEIRKNKRNLEAFIPHTQEPKTALPKQ